MTNKNKIIETEICECGHSKDLHYNLDWERNSCRGDLVRGYYDFKCSCKKFTPKTQSHPSQRNRSKTDDTKLGLDSTNSNYSLSSSGSDTQTQGDIKEEIIEKVLREVEGDKEILEWAKDNQMRYRVEEKGRQFVKELSQKITRLAIRKALTLADTEHNKKVEEFLGKLDEYLSEVNNKVGYLIVSRNINIPDCKFIQDFKEKIFGTKSDGEKL